MADQLFTEQELKGIRAELSNLLNDLIKSNN